jgi:transposase
MELPTDVNTYITLTEDGLPEALRPQKCEQCKSERIPHRHGCFWRWLFVLTSEFHIRIFRFFCPSCSHTMSVCPPFVETHHPYAKDVIEAAIDSHEQGKSFEEVAEDETIIVAGPVHMKTIWRWHKRWMQRLRQHHDTLWKILLHCMPTLSLPKNTSSNWHNLFVAWSNVRQRFENLPPLLVRLGQLALSQAMTVTV